MCVRTVGSGKYSKVAFLHSRHTEEKLKQIKKTSSQLNINSTD